MKKIFIVGLLAFTTSFASEVCRVDSDELLTSLITNHPSIKMAQESIKGSQEMVDAAMWGFFPTPSVEVSAKDSDRNTTVARLDQPIWTGGKITSRYDIATSKEQETLLELEENSYKLMDNFFNVLENYMQSIVQIKELQDGLSTLNKLNDMLDRRVEAGVSTQSDKELLKSRIEQINSDIIMAQNRYKISLMQFELMLDRKIECDINLKSITIWHSNVIEDSVARLLAFHPSLRKAEQQIQTSKYEVDKSRSAIMPTLNLRAEHRDGNLYSDSYNKSDNQNLVYFTFVATTNSGLSALSEISAAKIKVYELTFSKQAKEKELTDALLADYNNYEISKNRIKVLSNTIDSANSVLDSYTRLFLAGKRQWLDLVNSSRELMNYKMELQKQIVTKNILAYKLALKNGQINLLTGEIK